MCHAVRKHMISCLEVSYDLVPEELKRSCSLDSGENHLKCFSFQVDKENWTMKSLFYLIFLLRAVSIKKTVEGRYLQYLTTDFDVHLHRKSSWRKVGTERSGWAESCVTDKRTRLKRTQTVFTKPQARWQSWKYSPQNLESEKIVALFRNSLGTRSL